MIYALQNKLAPVAFGAAIAVPAALGLTKTPLPSADLSVVKGEYQSVYENAFSEDFPLSDLSKDVFNALTLGLFGQAHPDVVVGTDNWLFTIEEFREPSSDFDFDEELIRTQSALSEQGITLIPVVVPDKARIYADKLPRSRGDALESRYAEALAVLRHLEFPIVDLTENLAAGGEAQTYLRTDTHWSPMGAAFAADAISVQVEAGSATFETFTSNPQILAADLSPFVDAGRFEQWVGVGGEFISIPTTTSSDSGLGLFGSAEIGIVLVGTSYSARSELNFEGALKQATSHDVVNLAQEGRGPFAPMREALASGSITEINPQYVIWEIPERYIDLRK